MKHPTLRELPASRTTIDVFGGYNHNLRISDGEFFDMKNMTSSYYPVLSPRSSRAIYLGKHVDGETGMETGRNLQGMIAKEHLCYVENGRLFINNDPVELGLDPEGEKQLVSMGAYICIFPDQKYINTVDRSDCGSMGNRKVCTASVTFTPCLEDGSDLNAVEGPEPSDPAEGQYWLDTTVTPNALKIWSNTNQMWTQVATSYIRISSEEGEEDAIGYGFSDYDGVEITGLGSHQDQSVSKIDGNFVIQKVSEDKKSLIIIGFLERKVIVDGSQGITICRKIPEMDFVVESENRLWGCKYGSVDGNTVNQVYACKLGDFKNWNCFMGLSTDSYYANVGSDGPFTGAISYLGYPLFFKEECLHKVYGNYPANFQVLELACRGVQKGCGKSLAIINEGVYYKSKTGICVYDGALPVEISAPLGDVSYGFTTPEERREGVFGACGAGAWNKYYISMRRDRTSEYSLFVYDTQYKMWHREDETKVDQLCFCNGEVYGIIDGTIQILNGGGTERFSWFAETGIIGISSTDKKRLSRLSIRLSADPETRIRVFVDYDSVGEWSCVFASQGGSLRTVTVPIRSRRHDHLRLRIEGIGDGKIYAITKTMEQGSDV